MNEPNLRDSAKYRLITAIEAAISICNHIVARKFKRAPESYSDCFMILNEFGVVSSELAKKLGEMARFRNIVDLENFINEIANYIGKNESEII